MEQNKSMMNVGRLKITEYLMPALCVALALFMTAQLVIITILGVSFKGVRQYSVGEQPLRTVPKSESNGDDAKRALNKSGIEIARSAPADTTSSTTTNAFNPQPKHLRLLNNPTSWPPVENRLYPDMELYNQDGKLTRLSDLSGNVIIVQPVAMTCPLSQAYTGAHNNGKAPFKLCFPDNGVTDFAQRMQDYAGIGMKTPGLVFVQLLLYNMQNEAPSVDDAKQWANHFDLRTSNNQYVLVGTPEMVNHKSAMLIPGFQLVDRSYNLRSDSTGILPKRSLYNHFFPTLKGVLTPRVSVIGDDEEERLRQNSIEIQNASL